jgi:hypothetical protein
MYFYRWSLLLHPREGCGLLERFDDFPSATNNIRQVQGGATTAVGYRHDLEVEVEGLLKDHVAIFVFLVVLCTVYCFFNVSVLIAIFLAQF